MARSDYLKRIPEWKIVGYPKFDPLINGSLYAAPLFQNTRKTILYAPTWLSQKRPYVSKVVSFSSYGESSLELWALDIIRELSRRFNVCIKYHSRIYREPGDIYDQVDALIKELDVSEYVKVARDDNILPYMARANLMISDMSTACYEWFHFDRPIVFANPSPEHYKRSDDISSNTYAWQAGDVINAKEDILKFVRKNLARDEYREIRNRIFRYAVFQPDGRATERQARAITDFYERYEHVPYVWLMITTFAVHKWRRLIIVVRNRYYRLLKKEKIGR